MPNLAVMNVISIMDSDYETHETEKKGPLARAPSFHAALRRLNSNKSPQRCKA